MKNTKIMSLLLAGALLVGGTFLGTKALFSDTETSENKLILTTGKVDIQVMEDIWRRNLEDTNGDNIINAADDIFNDKYETSSEGIFTNVQPGDTFSRYISVIAQDNTYDVTIEAIKKELTGNDPELMKFISIDDSQLKNITKDAPLKANTNTGAFITVKIENSADAWKAFNGAKSLDLNAIYQIAATQAE